MKPSINEHGILDLPYPRIGGYDGASGRASDHIWRLVCGLAEPTRSNRLLFMLTAFLDDSDMSGAGPVAVLAGWVAPAKVWASFVDAWQAEVLDKPPPPIEIFKPNASNLGNPTQQQRLQVALNLIKDHGLVGASVVVPNRVYRLIMEAPNIDKRLRHPYAFALYTAVPMIARHYVKKGVSSKIDFVFDEQPGQAPAIHAAWPYIKATAPADIKPSLANPPNFRADKDEKALQAAHIWAWSIRRIVHDAWGKDDDGHFPEHSIKWPGGIEYVEFLWTPSKIEDLLAGRLTL